MTAPDCLRAAVVAIATNFLRTVLTTLGIIIGVGSVIVMMAVGAGARSEVERQITNLGSNLLVVNPSARLFGGRSSGAGSNLPLSEDDVKAIETKVPGVQAISGQLWASATVVFGNANFWTRIWGVHAAYLYARSWSIESGRDLSEQDVAGARRVALVGLTVAKKLFGDNDPVGEVFRIRNVPFTVIGTLTPKGQTSFGHDHDDAIFVPMTTARTQLIGKHPLVPDQVGSISVKFQEGADLLDAQEEIEQVLRQSRRVPPGDDDTFVVGNPIESMKARTAAQTTLGWLLAATAAISLIVGGIGIMNIMLVSVTERTREIGLRMAVGARRFDIMLQFLIEATTLCVLGGLIGVVLGVGAAFVTAGIAEWPILIPPQTILLALAAAAGVGILFGFLPARRAALLSPIDALRSE
ncbi:MAG TPA: ABC transporter permease [Hyphomicrobiaceae bacterium]|nr:ABC transporter permease [Hyphomicrobiaceae bacterium]